MQQWCNVPGEDLVAYTDGDLDEARHAEIKEHLKTCWACREQLASSEDIGRMVRSRFPLQDNPAARAEIMRQVRGIVAERKQPQVTPHFHGRRKVQRWPAIAAACLVAVLVVAVGLPMTTTANLNLARYISFVDERESSGPLVVAGDQEPPGEPITLDPLAGLDHGPVSFQAVEPERLPFDLELVEATTSGEHLLTLVYTDGQGTIVHLIQEPAARSTASASTERTEQILIGSTEALVQYTTIETVSMVIWERHGVVFDLWMVKSVGGGVAEGEGMIDIARAIIEAQMDKETP